MSTFTQVEQQTLDIDWFFTNGDDIAFVASGGAKLPLSVEQSKENLDALWVYFDQLPENCEIIVNGDLEKIIKDKVDDRYLSSFIEMSKKGLFSYDRTNFDTFVSEYHLVFSPREPLKFNQLPHDIQLLLARSKYNGEMKSKLDISLIS